MTELEQLKQDLEYMKSGALMEDDIELSSRIDRALIALEAPLNKDIFKEEFIEDYTLKLFKVNKVLRFIKRFQNEGTIKVFTEGCCCWFAYILDKRFNSGYGDNIMIDYISNHFGCQIDGRVYDITGDVTFKYTWSYWKDCTDRNLISRIMSECIYF